MHHSAPHTQGKASLQDEENSQIKWNTCRLYQHRSTKCCLSNKKVLTYVFRHTTASPVTLMCATHVKLQDSFFPLLWKYWLLLLFGRVMLLRKIKCGTILPYLICLIIKLNTVTTDLHLRLFHSQRCWLTSAAAQILTPEVDQSSSKTLPPLHIFYFNADSLYAFTRRCVN